jgi:hypothetical protein
MRWWIVLLVALSVAPAWAQDVATDTELFAGYCFGVSTISSLFGKAAALQDCDGNDRACLEKREMGAVVEQGYDAIYKRTSDYLNARRLFQERLNTAAGQGLHWRRNGKGDEAGSLRATETVQRPFPATVLSRPPTSASDDPGVCCGSPRIWEQHNVDEDQGAG